MLRGPVDLPFTVGQSVIYPGRGLALVEKVEDIEVLGTTLSSYVFLLKEGGRITVPLTKVKSSGIRPFGSEKDVHDVIACLKGRAQNTQAMWRHRADVFHKNLSSGDILKIAEVVRDLQRIEDNEAVSLSEREMYERALYLLISEVSRIKNCSITETVIYLEKESGKALHYRDSITNSLSRPTLSPARPAGRKKAPSALPPDTKAPNNADAPSEPVAKRTTTKPRLVTSTSGEKSNLTRLKSGPKSKQKAEDHTSPDPEIARLKHVAETLKQEVDSLTAQNERVESENEALQAKVSAVSEAAESLHANLALSRTGEEKLRQRVAELEATLAEIETVVAATPEPAVPKPRKRPARTEAPEPPVTDGLQLQDDGTMWNPAWG